MKVNLNNYGGNQVKNLPEWYVHGTHLELTEEEFKEKAFELFAAGVNVMMYRGANKEFVGLFVDSGRFTQR
jgi:hypothetical protein